jgi:hypothetical protein
MEDTNTAVVPETTEVVTPDVTTTDEVVEESVEEIKSRLAKAEELANNYKIRAEKAEKKAKEPVTTELKPEKNDTGISALDTIAFINAKVTEPEDIQEVVEWAQFKKIPVAQALKSDTIKTLLREKSELRATALATNTGGARRTTSKVSDETLMQNAAKGQLPESEAEMQRLVRLKMGLK